MPPPDLTSDSGDRAALYEHLYADLGYHSQLNLTHADRLIHLHLLPYYSNKTRSKRILDVGCSHGKGVEILWRHGFYANGMDISTTAIQMARQARDPSAYFDAADPSRPCGGDECFKQGSAAALPWANASFDALISTDMLEHLPTPLVPQVVHEFSRVVTEAMFMSIALKEEHNKFANRTLHETQQSAKWWKAHFEAAGEWRCDLEKPRCPKCTAENMAWLRCLRRGQHSTRISTLRGL